MIRTQRAFIEAAMAQVHDAKEMALPLLMVDAPDAPWTASSLRDLAARRDELDPILREAADVLVAFEVPFLEEEDRLTRQGLSLTHDASGFEVAMTDFERRFWEARFAEHRADPERWNLPAPPVYDVCEEHHLTGEMVRRAIRDHGATSFEDLAPLLGTSRTCATCHTAVTRMLIREVRREKEQRAKEQRAEARRRGEPRA